MTCRPADFNVLSILGVGAGLHCASADAGQAGDVRGDVEDGRALFERHRLAEVMLPGRGFGSTGEQLSGRSWDEAERCQPGIGRAPAGLEVADEVYDEPAAGEVRLQVHCVVLGICIPALALAVLDAEATHCASF